jgi:hypothetical protein
MKACSSRDTLSVARGRSSSVITAAGARTGGGGGTSAGGVYRDGTRGRAFFSVAMVDLIPGR